MKAALPDSPSPPRLLIVGNPWLGPARLFGSSWQLFVASLCYCVWDQLCLAALTWPLKAMTPGLAGLSGTGSLGQARWDQTMKAGADGDLGATPPPLTAVHP